MSERRLRRVSVFASAVVLLGITVTPHVLAQAVDTIIPLPDSLGGSDRPYKAVYNSANNTVFVASRRGSGLVVFDGETNAKLKRILLNGDPSDICYSSGSNKVYCVYQDSNRVDVISGAGHQQVASIRVGRYPGSPCYVPELDRLYFANRDDGTLGVIDCAADTVIASLDVGETPTSLYYDGDTRRLYCVRNASTASSLVVVELDPDTVSKIIPLPSLRSYEACLNSRDAKLYIWGWYPHQITVVSTSGDSLLSALPYGAPIGYVRMCFSPIGDKLYVVRQQYGDVNVVDGASDSMICRLDLGNSPEYAAYDGVFDRVYCSGTSTGYTLLQVMVVDCACDSIIASIKAGIGEPCVIPQESAVYCPGNRNRVVVFDAATDTIEESARVGMEVCGICFASDNGKVYASSYQDDGVAVVGAANRRVIRVIADGIRANTVVYNPLANRVYAGGGGDGLAVIDCASDGVVRILDRTARLCDLVLNQTANKWYLTEEGSPDIAVIDGAGDTLLGVVPSGGTPRQLCVSTARNKLYCADSDANQIIAVGCSDDTVVARIPCNAPSDMCYDSRRDRLWCAEYYGRKLLVVDCAGDSAVAEVAVPYMPMRLRYSPFHDRVYSAEWDSVSSHICAIDPERESVIASARLPSIFNDLLCAQAGLYCSTGDSVYVLDGASNRVSPGLFVGDLPWAMATDTTLAEVYVASTNGSCVGVISDVAGIAEGDKVEGIANHPEPTIVHGVLMFEPSDGAGRTAPGELLDVLGRRVLLLHAGANDVRTLAPGVYFIREGLRTGGEGLGKTQKVVVTR